MYKFDSPKFDDSKHWIQRKFQKGTAWNIIKMAGKSTEEELKSFLKTRFEEDDWPQMTNDEWKSLVENEKYYSTYQESINFGGSDGVLLSENQNNTLTIPQDPRSCWQLYKNRLGWDEDSITTLECATHGILRRLSIDTTETGAIKGLVIGHVQSGKTANMEALMAMAADHGWNFFIILSGTIENLRMQTLKRMWGDLNNPGNLNWQMLNHLSRKSPIGSRSIDLDFSNGSQMRYVTVCLKNSNRLKHLIEWIHEERLKHENMRVLIIDDEADQASISNTAVELNEIEKERKGINKLIVNLVEDEHHQKNKSNGKAKAINYVMYTATPYANFLNESTPESLYPKDFIWTLKTPKEYIGPNQIYGDDNNDGLDIKRTVEISDLGYISDIYEHKNDELPVSLKKAICWFFCAVSIMRYWGYSGKPVSMLLHTSQKTICHQAVAEAVSKWINRERNNTIKNLCRQVYEYETTRITKDDWFEQFKDYGIPKEKVRDYPMFNDISAEIDILLGRDISHIKMDEDGDLEYHNGLHLVIDNCKNNGITVDNEHIRLAYPEPNSDNYPDPAPAFIIIGGSTLSRGLTIEGLVSTFFLRTSKQADALMQMGRWFGYRKSYELLPRIWMTEDTIKKFEFLAQLETELREDLKRFMVASVSPIEYGPRIKISPKVSWLRLTSKRHMTNAIPAEMNFSGAKPQTTTFDANKEIQERNIKTTEEFISGLPDVMFNSPLKNCLVWKDISLEYIIDKLLSKFCFSNRSRVFNEIDAFCSWIKEISNDESLKKWSVIVAGKGNVQKYTSNSDLWNVNGFGISKVNRSRKTSSADETSIDIGVLRALKDCLADVNSKYFDSAKSVTKQAEVDDIRDRAGMGDIPQLIIYRIDKNSKAQSGSAYRTDLNFESDIIGLYISVPGEKINNVFSKKITINLPEKDEEVEMEENAIEN